MKFDLVKIISFDLIHPDEIDSIVKNFPITVFLVRSGKPYDQYMHYQTNHVLELTVSAKELIEIVPSLYDDMYFDISGIKFYLGELHIPGVIDTCANKTSKTKSE